MNRSLVAATCALLSEYARDGGAELGQIAGPTAIAIVAAMSNLVLAALRATDAETAALADEFAQSPQAHEYALRQALARRLNADPPLAADLQQRLARYEAEAAAHARSHNVIDPASTTPGSIVAQGTGATAVGNRGVYVTGDVGGSIQTGDTMAHPGAPLPPRRAGLPPALLTRLRRLLVTCAPFAGDGQLAALFADRRLAPWHAGLPQAESIAARVDHTINYLWQRRAAQEENGLVLFLRVLQAYHHPDDDRSAQLGALASAVADHDRRSDADT
jgi:hypothetical protein